MIADGRITESALRESALAFRCVDMPTFGIVAEPAAPSSLGVIVIVGGPQYRVGSHRQFVRLARGLARAGYTTMRFDYRGMGDTPGPPAHFEHAAPDIGAAVDALMQARPALHGVVLWGLCDGASAALMYLAAVDDARAAAAVLVNPWVRTEQSHARTQLRHYYAKRLMERAFWAKLLRGAVASGAIRDVLSRSMRAARAPDQGPVYTKLMARGWRRLPRAPLLLLSESDYTAREFEAFTASDQDWQRAMQALPAERRALLGADHTCSSPEAEHALVQATLQYLQRVEAMG